MKILLAVILGLMTIPVYCQKQFALPFNLHFRDSKTTVLSKIKKI